MKKKSIEERLIEDVINLFVNGLTEEVMAGKITEEQAIDIAKNFGKRKES